MKISHIFGLLVFGLGAYWIWGQFNPPVEKATNGAALVSVEIPKNLSSMALKGKRKFNANCASCHGKDAAGQDGIAPPLIHKIYEPNHHGDQAFQNAAKFGVRAHHWRFGDMPSVEGVNQQDVTEIIKYIRELQRENNIN